MEQETLELDTPHRTKRRHTAVLKGQNFDIYAHLRAGHKITTLIAMHPPFNCCRLSERIREIEDYLGFDLTHERIKVGDKYVTEYSCPKDKKLG